MKRAYDLTACMKKIRALIDDLPGDTVVLWAPPDVGFEIEYTKDMGFSGAIGLMECGKAQILRDLS